MLLTLGLRAVLAAAIVGSAVGCANDDNDSRGAEDYTVVAKNTYLGGEASGGRRGYYVTILLFGAERETQVSHDCYERARLGSALPTDCRT